VVGGRSRHQDKDIEKFIRSIEDRGWTVSRKNSYFKAKCGCGKHLKTIHLTPSGGSYLRDLKGWFNRTQCWATGGTT